MSYNPFDEVCDYNPSLEKAQQLLESGQGMKYLEVKDHIIGRTPLHTAAYYDKSDGKIVELLIQYGANMEARDYFGSTPLIIASERNNPSATFVLLRHGANIKAQNKNGETALYCAFRSGHKEVAEMILNSIVDSAIASSSSLSFGLGKGLEEARNLVMNTRDKRTGDTALYWAELLSRFQVIRLWEAFQREKEQQIQEEERSQRLKHRHFTIESKDELQLLLSLYPNYIRQLVEWKSINGQTTRGKSKQFPPFSTRGDSKNNNNNKEWNQLEETIRSYLRHVESIEQEYGDSLLTLASLHQQDEVTTYNRAKGAFDERKKQLQQHEDELNQMRRQSVLVTPQSVAGLRRRRRSRSNIGSSKPTTPTTRVSEEQVTMDPNHPILHGIKLKAD